MINIYFIRGYVTHKWSTFFTSLNEINSVYFILRRKIDVYLKQIKMVFSHSETIRYQSQPMFKLVIDITFWITSDFSNHLMQVTSKGIMPITF